MAVSRTQKRNGALSNVGSYIYISLNNFIGITLSMARLVLQGTLSLPVLHSLRQASRFRTLPITLSKLGYKMTLVAEHCAMCTNKKKNE